jgi:hypothetical protein
MQASVLEWSIRILFCHEPRPLPPRPSVGVQGQIIMDGNFAIRQRLDDVSASARDHTLDCRQEIRLADQVMLQIVSV